MAPRRFSAGKQSRFALQWLWRGSSNDAPCGEEISYLTGTIGCGGMRESPDDLTEEFRQLWPDYRPTTVLQLPGLAARAGVASVFVKLEGERPLGNFKVLGGMLAGLKALARATGVGSVRA